MSGPPNIDPQSALAWELDVSQLGGTLPAVGERQLIRLSFRNQRIEIAPAETFDAATHQIIHVRGEPFISHLSERDAVISRVLQHQGYWEFAESLLLATRMERGSLVLDLGANIGYYTLAAARQLGPTGAVFAAEPDPANFVILLANVLLAVQRRGELARVDLQCVALDSESGTKTLTRFQRNLGLHTLFPPTSLHTSQGNLDQSISVSTTTLDDLRFGSPSRPAAIERRIHLIKADTQGAELAILKGGCRTLANDRPLLCLEFEPSLSGEARSLELLHWLADHQYRECLFFYSTETDPLRMLRQFQSPLAVLSLEPLVRQRRIGPFGTLLAYPCEL